MLGRFLYVLVTVLSVVGVIFLIIFWTPTIHWLGIHTGTLNEPGPYYGFWSGFGSDIGELALIVGVFQLARKHNCHERGCWRLGLFPDVDSEGWHYCRKHHKTDGEQL